MPIAKIESVIRVSSEDALNPARNLALSAIGNNVKKWICQKKGEKQIYAIFQLKDRYKITHIVVGNENSAFLEVLVGNDESDEKEYKVLLPATELMTVHDTRAGKNKNAVHFFKEADFVKQSARGEWNQVKVVCSQPYDPHTRYGLSCFVPKSITDNAEVLDSKGDVAEGRDKKSDTLSDDAKKDLNDWKEDVLQRLAPGSSGTPSDKLKNAKQKLPNHKSPLKTPAKNETKASSKDSTRKRPKERAKDESSKSPAVSVPSPPPTPAVTAPPQREFRKLMDDVRFTMSGYENPLRSEIRNKGLEMGARYAGDWDPRCTHLICAFVNTPKFNKVRGQGKIVTKDWVEECHRKRKRLPWRKFALDSRDRNHPISEDDESDDETKQDDKKKKGVDRRRRLPSSDSDSDSEDEVERVRARKAARLVQGNATAMNGVNVKRERKTNREKTVLELYDAETDVEDYDDVDNSDADPDFNVGSQDAESEEDAGLDESLEPEYSNLSEGSEDDDDDIDEPSAKKRKQATNKERKRKQSKALKKNKLDEAKKTKKNNYGNCADKHDLSDDDGDDKATPRPDTSALPLPALPNIPPHTYYLAEDEKNDYRTNLTRYVNAFGGKIAGELTDDVEYAITDDSEIAKEIAEKYPSITVVKSEWVWNCNDADRLLPTEGYTF